MSTFVTPRTWTDGEDLTAARLNTVRDNLAWLKAALALLMGGSDSDVYSGSQKVSLTVATANTRVFEGKVIGESFARIVIRPEGIQFGDGTAEPSNELKTIVEGGAKILNFSGNLRITDKIEARSLIQVGTAAISTLNFIELRQTGTDAVGIPLAPASGYGRLYYVEIGGLGQLRVRWPNGNNTVIASES